MTARLDEGSALDRAFDYDPTLEQEVLASLHVDDQSRRVMFLPDMQRVRRVLVKVARGLFALRYGRTAALSQIFRAELYQYDVTDTRPARAFVSTFSERFGPKGWTVVQPGVFSYVFVRAPGAGRIWCVMNMHDSFWAVVDMPHPRRTPLIGRAQGQLFPNV